MSYFAVTGSRGFIGGALAIGLIREGHRVIRLLSSPPFNDGIAWKPLEPMPAGTLSGVDAVVHLGGESIMGLWTKSKKARIRESRIVSTKHLADAIDRDGVPTFVCGSAIGYYGDRGEETLTEESNSGDNFLAEVCRDWEAASRCSARVVNLRTSLVLSPFGGALAPMLRAFRLGGGAVIGDGRQWNSWITIHDMVAAIDHILMTPMIAGPVNMCTSNPVTNRVFGRTLAKVLGRPYLFTVPGFALKMLPGQFAKNTLLASQRALPAKLLGNGFRFQHDTLDTAIRLLLTEHRTPNTEHRS